MDEFTRKFNTSEDREVQTHYILSAVYDALKEKGYDPINQIVGYILSEDPYGYLTDDSPCVMISNMLWEKELLNYG